MNSLCIRCGLVDHDDTYVGEKMKGEVVDTIVPRYGPYCTDCAYKTANALKLFTTVYHA